MNENSWINYFLPETIDDIVGHNKTISEITKWLDNFQDNKKKVLLVLGSSGSGKTSTIHRILDNYNYNIHKFNILDFLNRKQIKERVERIITTKNIHFMIEKNRKTIVVIDEIEGINANTKTLVDIIHNFSNLHKKSKNNKKKKKIINVHSNIPVICIATETYLKKMNELQRNCDIIRFKRPRKLDLLKILRKILKKTGMKMNTDLINYIINLCNYDFRKMINILQFLYYTNNEKNGNKMDLSYLNILDKTSNNSNIELFKSCETLLYNRVDMDKTLIFYNIEKVLLPLMIHQNYIPVLFSKCNKGNKIFPIIFKISQHISNNDLVNSFIYNSHNWDLQHSHALLSCYYPSYLINEYVKYENKNCSKVKIKFTSILSKVSIYHVNYNQYNYICRTIKNYKNYFDYTIMKYICKNILYHIFSNNINLQNKGIHLIKYYDLKVTDISKLIKFSNVMIYESKFNKKMCHHFKKIMDKL